VPGVTVTFTILDGPNAGTTGTATTDENGVATFTYSDVGGAGTDHIQANVGGLLSNIIEKIWVTGEGETRACEDLDHNGECDPGEPDVPGQGGTFANPVVVAAGFDFNCAGFPFFGTNVQAPKITVRGNMNCPFAGGRGITLTSTGTGQDDGVFINGHISSGGGTGITINSATGVTVDGGSLTATFGGSEIRVTSVGDQHYINTTVSSPKLIMLTSTGGSVIGSGSTFQSSNGGAFYVNFPAGSGPGPVDFSNAHVFAGALIWFISRGSTVNLDGAQLENASAHLGALVPGGDIIANSAIGAAISFNGTAFRDGGFNQPFFNGVSTCVANATARTVGTPAVCPR
jgi:hypothetical protein